MTPNQGSDAAFRPATVPGATAVGPMSTGGPSAAGGQPPAAQQTKDVAKDKAAEVAATAKDKAADVAGTAKDKAADVAGTAADKAADVAGTAKAKVADVTGETARQVKQVYGDAKTELSEQAQVQQGRLAEAMQSIGGELSTLAKDSSADGVATQTVRRAGEAVQQAAGWLEDRDPASVLDEVRSFARRRPGAFIALALGAGILAGRLTRGLKDAGNPGPQAAPATVPPRRAAVTPAVTGLNAPALGISGTTAPVVPALPSGGFAGGPR